MTEDDERARMVAYQVGIDSWAAYAGHGAHHVSAVFATVRAEEREKALAECEAIAWDRVYACENNVEAMIIADAISALGKGEGK